MRVLVFLGLALFYSDALAQLKGNFKSYTVEDGLSQNTVWDVIQDYRGYLWIGTADGVDRFDGYKFYHYKHDPNDSTTLGAITLFKFLEDSLKQLWISHSKGLDLYDRNLDRFKRIYRSKYSCAVVDEDYNSIWLFDGNYRVIKIAKSSGSIQDTIQFNENINTNEVVRPAVRMGSKMIVNDRSRIFIVDVLTRKCENWDIQEKLDWSSFRKIDADSFIAISNGSLITFNIRTRQRSIKILNSKPSDPLFSIYNFVEWNNGLYGASEYGIYQFDLKTMEVVARTADFKGNEIGTTPYTQNLYVDNSNNLYVCTNGNGLKIYSPYHNRFKHLTTDNPKTNFTRAIYADNYRVWVGIYGRDMVVFDRNGQFVNHRFSSETAATTVFGVFGLGKEKLAIFHQTGIMVSDLDLRNKRLVSAAVVSYPRLKTLQPNRYLYNTDEKLIVADSSFNTIQQIDLPENGTVTDFLKMGQNLYWIGTSQGLYQIDVTSNKVKQSSIQVHVKSILKTQRGEFYVATISGLFRMNSAMEILEVMNDKNYLPNSYIYGLLEDKHEFVWLSHNKGISRLNTIEKTFLHFDANDGLQSNEFNSGSYFIDDKGLLYFGGINGVNIIDPEKIPANAIPPMISINEINVGDMPFKTDSSYNEMHSLTLSYNQNTLSFDFSALEYSNIEECSYAYYLEPYETDWIKSGKRHFARYANLPPGQYKLKLKATNGDGVWISQPREFFIQIVPPIWQRSWFVGIEIFVGILTLATFVFFYVRTQQAKLKKKLELQHQIELERLRISRDLHDNVGAHLSYLISNMDWMADHPEEWESKGYEKLKTLSDAGRQAILTLRQTIWALGQESLTVEEFADRFKQYVLKMKDFNKGISVTFQEKMLGSSRLSSSLALHLFRICQEAFNNAMKHSGANQIQITFTSNENMLFHFEMSDNGLGFDYSLASKNGQFGLRNMQARAKECNAKLDLKTSPGKGTVISVLVTESLMVNTPNEV